MQDLSTLKKMIYQLSVILNKKQRRQMVGMLIIILIGSLFELLGVSAMLPFIQALLTPEDLMAKPYIKFLMGIFNVTEPQSVLIMVGIGIVVIYIVKNIYLAISAYLQTAYSNNIRRELSVLMLRSYMNRPYSFFVENGSGVIMRGITDDMMGVYNVIFNAFKFLSEGLVIVAVGIYLFLTDAILAGGVAIVGLLCMLIIVLGVKKKLTKLSYLYRNAAARLNKWAVQINSGIKDIMVFNRRELFVESYDKAYEDANVANTKSTFANLIPERIIEALCISGIIITVLIRLMMGVDAAKFVPKMAVFAMGAFRLLPSISRVTGYITIFIYNRTMVESAYENIVSARECLKEAEGRAVSEMDTKGRTFESEIDIRNIDWQYPKGKNKVLSGLNLTIHKGEAIGIVGESGSGKSTLADLILRLYKPQAGGIYMDGADINAIPDTWSRVLAYVPQSVFLTDDTIRANVAFGAADVKDEDIWEALRRASLAEFVKGLPEGLDTIVGERGVKFSGGQRQRIAIARALYINPQILILDEATSALDNETEEAVMEAIDSLAGTITLIIIAHRVTTLKNCDKIYEIKDGKAVERNKGEIIGI